MLLMSSISCVATGRALRRGRSLGDELVRRSPESPELSLKLSDDIAEQRFMPVVR